MNFLPVFEPALSGWLCAALLLGELALGLAIIWKIPYTEIDWKAYMQEVQGVLDGEWDYLKLRGGTGPLVYPAGFVHMFALFHGVTGADPNCCRLPPTATTESARCVSGGGDVRLAQYLFLAIYLGTHGVVLSLYRRSQLVPPWACVLLCLSLRVHSLYVLRLFNDCVAMLLVYVAVLALVRGRWSAASVLYSLAVSVKMNALLLAPALAIVFLRGLGWRGSIERGLLFVVVQLGLVLPFLTTTRPAT